MTLINPSRALDATVARLVDGVEFKEPASSIYCPHCGAFADHSDGRCQYSTNRHAALSLLVPLAQKHGFTVSVRFQTDSDLWVVRLFKHDAEAEIVRESFALAVCIAVVLTMIETQEQVFMLAEQSEKETP